MSGQTQQQERESLDYHPFDWTPEAVEALRTRWAIGKTASQIAAVLGTTKNAVISKVHRLKLPQHGQQGKTVPKRRPSQGLATQVAKVRAQRSEQPQMASPDASGMKLLKGAAWAALPGSSPVPLIDLERGQCKWPIGDVPMLFCGLAADGTYCSVHARLSRSAAK